MWWWLGALIAILLSIGWILGIVNRLRRLRNHVHHAWNQIEMLLQKRYDLIFHLVEKDLSPEQPSLQKVLETCRLAQTTCSRLKACGGPTEHSLQELIEAERQLNKLL